MVRTRKAGGPLLGLPPSSYWWNWSSWSTPAQLEWVNGTFNSLFDLSRGTIFGPFGGRAGGGPGLSEAHAAMAARFHDGTAELEVVQTMTTSNRGVGSCVRQCSSEVAPAAGRCSTATLIRSSTAATSPRRSNFCPASTERFGWADPRLATFEVASDTPQLPIGARTTSHSGHYSCHDFRRVRS